MFLLILLNVSVGTLNVSVNMLNVSVEKKTTFDPPTPTFSTHNSAELLLVSLCRLSQSYYGFLEAVTLKKDVLYVYVSIVVYVYVSQ